LSSSLGLPTSATFGEKFVDHPLRIRSGEYARRTFYLGRKAGLRRRERQTALYFRERRGWQAGQIISPRKCAGLGLAAPDSFMHDPEAFGFGPRYKFAGQDQPSRGSDTRDARQALGSPGTG
jgi:hypothetical protein